MTSFPINMHYNCKHFSLQATPLSVGTQARSACRAVVARVRRLRRQSDALPPFRQWTKCPWAATTCHPLRRPPFCSSNSSSTSTATSATTRSAATPRCRTCLVRVGGRQPPRRSTARRPWPTRCALSASSRRGSPARRSTSRWPMPCAASTPPTARAVLLTRCVHWLSLDTLRPVPFSRGGPGLQLRIWLMRKFTAAAQPPPERYAFCSCLFLMSFCCLLCRCVLQRFILNSFFTMFNFLFILY